MTLLVIKTTRLTRTYGKQTAVLDLNLAVKSGSIFGLLGPNGAGKTTTIKMLTTLLSPTSGKAEVAGFDITTEASEVRKRIGYVPQMLSADGSLTGQENLELSAKLYGIPKAQIKTLIADALNFMGLDDVAHRMVKTYSGGMIRRLELAQAMLHRPAVLFLDEPTPGLDPIARRLVWDRLKELQRNYNMTILITTHDMEEADFLCDELAIMHKGNIAASGPPSELKASIGENATLEDVFESVSKGADFEGGSYRDVRQIRRTTNRLG